MADYGFSVGQFSRSANDRITRKLSAASRHRQTAKCQLRTLKGLAWGMANKEATFDLLKTQYAEASLGDNPVAVEFWELVQTYYTAPDSVKQHGTFRPEAWKFYMSYLTVGEGEQRAMAGTVDISSILTDEIVLAGWEGLDMEAAIAK